MDYHTVDLGPWCNATFDQFEHYPVPEAGRHEFHGLPFLIGPDTPAPAMCAIELNGSMPPLTIPIAQQATHIIVAHRLVESDMMAGGPTGVHVADYRFHSSKDSWTAPIRERFHIARLAGESGLFDGGYNNANILPPRHEGNWHLVGQRQTGVTGDDHVMLCLWVWQNPDPDQRLEAIEFVPKGPRFVVAALTRSTVAEFPFVRTGKREVRVTLLDGDDAGKDGVLEVDVDRGMATYPYALPQADADEFLNDPVKGWGEAQNEQLSPSYVEVAAVPSATITISHEDEVLGAVRWADVEQDKVVENDRIRVELLDRGRNWVHVTVVDDESGQPVPCRVHFRSLEGIPYQPHGHHNHVNGNISTWHSDVGGDLRLGQITYAYIDGKCQGWLPRGEVIVDIARGFEYEPLRCQVRIEPGQRELTLRLKRWIHMNERRWFSGDSHVHFLCTQGGHTESQGEDLNVVNLLQSQWGSLFTNTEEFTGQASVCQRGNNIVYVSQENRQHFLGHLTLWGLKEPVMPMCTDGAREAELGGTLEVTMSEWADQCHAQGGTVIIPHLPIPNGEPAALIATGRADAVEMMFHGDYNHREYYNYLNCGYRLPLVGGTDKMSADMPVGLYRTYAYIPPDRAFTYDNWCAAVRAGRTFLSAGPIIQFTVDGHMLGDIATIGGAGKVEVHAWAESIFPLHTLQIVQSGQVVASTESEKGTRRLELKTHIAVTSHCWLAARCGGPNYEAPHHVRGLPRGIFAHTSPIYVACGEEWWMFDREVAEYMLTLVDGNIHYIRHGACHYPDEHTTHHHGLEDHIGHLETPFREAQAAIHKRMHALGIPH